MAFLNSNVCGTRDADIIQDNLEISIFHTGQAAMLLTVELRGSKITRNCVFDCHLSPYGRQMAIENSVSDDFHLRSSIVFMFKIAA